MGRTRMRISLDIGSRSLKAAGFDDRGDLALCACQPIRGKLGDCLKDLLESLASNLPEKDGVLTAVTGAKANFYSQLFGIVPVNSVLSATLGARRLVPEAGAILEIGGEHATFIRLSPSGNGGSALRDFYVNSACSSGTGSFLEQEAHRLGLSLEELGRLASASYRKVRIAGRCAVFAKTDVVHMHQNGVPLEDMASALCHAVAQNVANELIISRKFQPPLALIGGGAANPGILEALRSILDLDPKSLIIPGDHVFCGAIGAFLWTQREEAARECSLLEVIEKTAWEVEMRPPDRVLFPPLTATASKGSSPRHKEDEEAGERGLSDDRFIGIDIGSTATKVICINAAGEVQAKVILPTRGQALRSVFQGLSRIREQLGPFPCRGLGITGSGRGFVAAIIGADVVLNEISAHAIGGCHLNPEVDTIFDIGGQDSKYIQLEHGSVTHFAMNKVCSAGTGSFLEEMAELLGLDIEHGFASEAMRSSNPVDLGERCTVFIGTEIARRLQEGQRREDLAAGLCYSVVNNYLSRVVGRSRIGRFISFQGGVAGNAAIVSALENVLKKPVHVPEHHEVAGALGVALLASRRKVEKSGFRGFEQLNIGSIETRTFECQRCANNCRIQYTRDSSGHVFNYGGLCDRYEERTPNTARNKGNGPDLFEERGKLLERSIKPPVFSDLKGCLGLPRALHFYELLPFWSVFFNELHVGYTISEPTNRETVRKGISNCPTNPCLPVKTAYGHCLDLWQKGVERIFIPSIPNLPFLTKTERMNHVCPATQAWPFTARALFSDRIAFLTPTLRFGIPRYLKSDIVRFGRSLGLARPKTLAAFRSAIQAQQEFYKACQDLGRQVLAGREKDKTYAVILARPYTAGDSVLWLHLKKIFDELDIIPIPLDMVAGPAKTSGELAGMYWYSGKRFLQAVEALADRPDVVFIHLSNFGCGADSFIIHFLRKRLKNRPYLELEIDEHIQLTGMKTRLEAFLFSFKNGDGRTGPAPFPLGKIPTVAIGRAKLLIPQMSVHSLAFRAALRAFGVQAEVLPLPDEESVYSGKQAVAGGECLPCSFVIGDMLSYLGKHPGETPRPAFLMISGDGPCRLGQYPYLQRLVLDDRGFGDVPIFDASQDQKFYERFGLLPAAFKRRAWRGVVATDLLFRKWRECRPYMRKKEFIDALYSEEIRKLCECIENNGDLPGRLKESVARFDRCCIPTSSPKPIVAVLGENYVRCNPVANGRIADQLEDLGAEVWFPSLYEWVFYGNWTARLHCRYEKQYKRRLSLSLINSVQRWDEFRIARSVKGKIRNLEEPSVGDLIKMSSPYIPSTFEGETLIEVARTLDFCKKGVSGVIRVVPFGCIMGTIVETLSEKISRDLSGFPIMTIQHDGQEYPSQTSRLEGFMVRARIWQERSRRH